jgi:putative ABC transport system permease protein
MSLSLALLLLRGSLLANGFRLALTIASIALGVALGGAVHTVHTSALAEIDRAAHVLSGRADIEIRGARSGFDDSAFAKIARHRDVEVASPVVEVIAALPDGGTIRVLGIDAFRAARLQPAFVADMSRTGATESASILDPARIWLTPAASAKAKARTGERVRLVAGGETREYTVGGILGALEGGGVVAVMDIAAAQTHFGRLGRISRIEGRLRPGVDSTAFARGVANELPPGVVVEPARSASTRAESITRAYRVNLDALALVALATGAFLVFSTLALQAARRRQEFALLRALGLTRRGIATLLAIEGGTIGALGASIGTALGVFASRELLKHAGADLGAGFFSGERSVFEPSALALAVIALIGIAMCVAAGLRVARAVGRMQVAEALRDRAVDQPALDRGGAGRAALLFALGLPLLFTPPWNGLPIGGYIAIALWLAAAVMAVGPLCRALLRRIAPTRAPVASLALAQVRHLPGHLAASVAGIVVSAALCAAMAIMVFSFRVSLQEWLGGVVGADLYVRASEGDSGFFTREDQDRVAALRGVRAMEALRYDRLTLDAAGAPLSVIARPIDERILHGFQAEPPRMPAPLAGVLDVWISEAARDLHGWKTGDRIRLPIGPALVEARIAGIIRDYARTWGAVLVRLEDYRRLTGDTRANDLAIHLSPGATSEAVRGRIRELLPRAEGLDFEDAQDLRTRSLAIFDRSFAVTYALEAIAIVIGLAGVTSSFAALAWSRRREFGVLRFLGLTRREVLRMLALEGAATGALGALIGLVAGAAISLVLLHVVNRQSFHWTLEVHWPVTALAALFIAIVALCAFGARASATVAVRSEAILAVKDDA